LASLLVVILASNRPKRADAVTAATARADRVGSTSSTRTSGPWAWPRPCWWQRH
jgi:hypothetical protein